MSKLFRFVVIFVAFVCQCLARDVVFNWVASTSPNITSYDIYVGTASGGPFTTLVGSVAAPATTYTIHHVLPGTYYYVATAINSSGVASGDSAPTTATIVYSNCDLNEDGTTNVLDYQLLANIITGHSTCPGTESCDVNRDGSVNVLDLQVIANVITQHVACTD